jgi:hypothetical protein
MLLAKEVQATRAFICAHAVVGSIPAKNKIVKALIVFFIISSVRQ